LNQENNRGVHFGDCAFLSALNRERPSEIGLSMDITSHSHEAVKGHSWLSIHPAMAHSHPPGWDPKSVPEIYAFADYVLKMARLCR